MITQSAQAADGGGTAVAWGYEGNTPVIATSDSRPEVPHSQSADPVRGARSHIAAGRVSEDAVSVAAGRNSSCVVLSNGRIACWGAALLAWKGMSSRPRYTPAAFPGFRKVVSAAVSRQTICAASRSGRVACSSSGGPVRVVKGLKHARTVSVMVTDSDVCALLRSGRVKCRSLRFSGKPRYVPGVRKAKSMNGPFAVIEGGKVTCWFNASVADNRVNRVDPNRPAKATIVPGITGAKSVSANRQTGCAVVDGGAVKCWGANAAGELGDVRATPECVKPAHNDRDCDCPTPVVVPGVNSVTSVSVGTAPNGDGWVCAVTTGHELFCWGQTGGGMLGDGQMAHSWYDESGLLKSFVGPTQINTPGVRMVSVGGEGHVCVLVERGGVTCWGDNVEGAVGARGRDVMPFVKVLGS